MTAQEFEKQVLVLLAQRFTKSDDPGLSVRRQQLIKLFRSLDDPIVTSIYLARLLVKIDTDALSRQFHEKLATPTRDELLKILQDKTKDKALSPPAGTEQKSERKFRLIDEDKVEVRLIAPSDPEFASRYVDLNIEKVTSDPDPKTAEHHTMVVYYQDGRNVALRLARIPARTSVKAEPGKRFARVRFSGPLADHYLLRKGTIFPVDHNGDMMFNDSDTPNLIDARTTIELNIILRRQRLEIAELTNTFAGFIGMSAGVLDFGMTLAADPRGGFSVRPRKAPPAERAPSGGGPPSSQYRVTRQYKKVGAQEMLTWENQGGHTIQHHSPHHTRRMLRERVIGGSEIPAPRTERGGQTAPDFRVWRKDNRSDAASAWADQSTMHKAMGDLINRNLDDIRKVTAAGGEVVLERQPVGYKTGSGWVKTKGGTAEERAIFWDDNLTGVTVIIKPRRGHIPNADDPESWFVFTAYPDRAYGSAAAAGSQ